MNRDIPAPIEREVRKRCGYCCVLCGQPIVEYDHMTPFSEARVHEASNITLLCTQCHRKKTSRLISIEAIKAADKNPYAEKHGVSAAERFSYPSHLPYDVKVGSSVLTIHSHVAQVDAIVIDNASFLRFTNKDGLMLLSFAITDRNGRPLVTVNENMLQVYPDAWDVVFQGTTLEVRQDPLGTKPFCCLDVKPEGVSVRRWETTHNGKTIVVRDDGDIVLEPGGRTLSQCVKIISPWLDPEGKPIGPPVSAVGVVNDGTSLRW